MNKRFIILLAFLLLGLTACSQEQTAKENPKRNSTVPKTELVVEKKDVRKAVWEQLSSGDKSRIKGTWKDATYTKMVLRDKGQEVYLVDFKMHTKHIPNNMIIYADINTFKIIGHGITD